MRKQSPTPERSEKVDPGNESAEEPELVLVGNIKKTKPDNPDWHGTSQFHRGQRIYLIDGKGSRIRVLGRYRQKGRFTVAWISSKHTENWRIKRTLIPRVLEEEICYEGFRFKGIDINDVEQSLNQRGEWPYS